MESTVASINCELCHKKFSQKSSLNRHLREQHLQPGLYHCNQCGSRFSKKYNLQVHIQHVHSINLKQIKCSHCKSSFTKLASLKKHDEIHHKKSCTTALSSNSVLDLNNEIDAQTLAESVLKELKQLQKEIQLSDFVPEHFNKEQEFAAIENGNAKFSITIKDTLYPLGYFTLLKTKAIKRLDGVKYLICEFCDKEFRKTYNYLRHRRIHTKVRPFVCILCKKSFSTTAQLKTHCSIHKLHEKFGLFHKLYRCPNCKEGFSAMQKLDKHLCSVISCSNVAFKCPHCFKSYKTLKSLLRHNHFKKDNELEMLKTILPSPLAFDEKIKLPKYKENFECRFCGILVNGRMLLNQHTKRHENLFVNQCAICQCSYVTQTGLKMHTKVHLNTKKFKCHYCNKYFQTDQSCRRHMLAHLKLLLRTHEKLEDENDTLALYPTFLENEKKCQIETSATPIIKSSKKRKISEESFAHKLLYKCSECGKSFRYKAWLKKHYKYKHTSELRRECGNCLRTFRTKQSLQSHLIVHSTNRVKLTCQVCGRQYASSKSLKVHLRIHTQETPFSCDKCSRLFRTSGHLIQHRKSNHEE